MDSQEPRMVAANKRKHVIRARGWGGATHNAASAPGDLRLTIWGRADKEPDREVALVLDEAGIRQLVGRLRKYGLA